MKQRAITAILGKDEPPGALPDVAQMLEPANLVAVAYGVEARVIAMIADRQKMGIKKYGMTVSGNPLPLIDWLRHALEESLDQAIYLQRAIDELDKLADDGK